jgi:hypothetical protein
MSKAPAKKTSLWQRLKDTVDPDRALMAATGSLIEAVAVKRALDIDQEKWAPGKPLKLLFAGYVGTRNTGADVRVEEMIRQIRRCAGDDNLELTIMSVDENLSAGYFRTVRQVELPTLFPRFLASECPRHHGVIACEGSMFKSKFASALSTMMAGSLGFAAAEDKLSVGYGAEAGAMTPALSDFVAKHCAKSLVLCRNEPSRKVLGDLGVRTTGGTDTAWTFEPAPLSRGAQLLRDAGWDGQTKILALCPINPFWWPVKPDLRQVARPRPRRPVQRRALLLDLLPRQQREDRQEVRHLHPSLRRRDQRLHAGAQGLPDPRRHGAARSTRLRGPAPAPRRARPALHQRRAQHVRHGLRAA